MIYQMFFVLAMLLALALCGLVCSALWRILAASRLELLRRTCHMPSGELADFLARNRPYLSRPEDASGRDPSPQDIVAAAAGRESHLAELTAFTVNEAARKAAVALLVLTGAAVLALAAYGYLKGGLIYLLDGLLLALIALTVWGIWTLLAGVHHCCKQSLSLLAEALRGSGSYLEEALAPDAKPSRIVKIELALFALFLLLMISRYFLFFLFDLDLSTTSGFAVSLGSFLALCFGFLIAMGRLHGKPGKKGGV